MPFLPPNQQRQSTEGKRNNSIKPIKFTKKSTAKSKAAVTSRDISDTLKGFSLPADFLFPMRTGAVSSAKVTRRSDGDVRALPWSLSMSPSAHEFHPEDTVGTWFG